MVLSVSITLNEKKKAENYQKIKEIFVALRLNREEYFEQKIEIDRGRSEGTAER